VSIEHKTQTMSTLKVVLCSPQAKLPQRALGSAGYDLYSACNVIVPARGKAIVNTDVRIRVPDGTYGRIAPRSGLAWNHHIAVGAGVIDPTYNGIVGIVLFNHSTNDFKVEVGDRCAQLICEKLDTPIVEEVQELDATERGEKGFGSTGISAPIEDVNTATTKRTTDVSAPGEEDEDPTPTKKCKT